MSALETCVRDVACGDLHTCALLENGTVWACGTGDNAQLGINSRQSRVLFTLVGGGDAFDGSSIVSLDAAGWHSAAITAQGILWTWGHAAQGRLGHGDEIARLTPTKLERVVFGGSSVSVVACGWHHTIVSTANGQVWTFGSGCHGQLGHGDKNNKLIPALLKATSFGGASIATVGAGSGHSVAVTCVGRVWIWGFGWALGLND